MNDKNVSAVDASTDILDCDVRNVFGARVITRVIYFMLFKNINGNLLSF